MVRGLCFCVALLLLVPLGVSNQGALVVPSLSPFVAVASLLAIRVLSLAACLGLAVGVVAVLKRRWFCHWVCPTGLLADIATRCGLRRGRRCPRLPSVGSWIALITIGGAFVGYPLLLWLDPLALFCACFGVFQGSSEAAPWWLAAGLAGVLLISIVWPGLWCLRLCPLGATQDLLADVAGGMQRLIGRAADSPRASSGLVLPRRIILGSAVGVAWAMAARALQGQGSRCLRPPGAAEEAQFVGVCIRCGNCTRVCPANIIHPDLGEQGIAGLLAPVVRFTDDYCREDCTRCTDVCPSGALAPVTIDDKVSTVMGVPHVDMERCLLGDDRECSICRNRCPFEAISLKFCEVEYTLTPRVDLAKCPGCGACEVACPTTPLKAIVVRARDWHTHPALVTILGLGTAQE
ncbi:MAG: 4Fe-4S binding protein [Pirellulaceae bacterium]